MNVAIAPARSERTSSTTWSSDSGSALRRKDPPETGGITATSSPSASSWSRCTYSLFTAYSRPAGSGPRLSTGHTSSTRVMPSTSRSDHPARSRNPAKSLTFTRIPTSLVVMAAAAQNSPASEKGGHRLPRRPLGPVGTWIAAVVIAALVLNYWLASRSLSEAPRIRIPYSPLFLDQVRDGNVDSITSQGSFLQGTFRVEVRYPATGSDARTARRFSTLIPAFADTRALSNLLQQKQVVINAEPLDTGAAWWKTLLFGFGPTALLIGLLLLVMRRGRGNVLGSFGR